MTSLVMIFVVLPLFLPFEALASKPFVKTLFCMDDCGFRQLNFPQNLISKRYFSVDS